MRDLEKIKAKKVYNMDKGKISLVLATGIAVGVMVFLVGLLLGLKKPGEAEASPLDPLEELISEGTGEGENEAGGGDEIIQDESYEYASKLSEDRGTDMIVPPLIPAGEGDDPMPVEPVMQASLLPVSLGKKVSGQFKIPSNPGEVAFVEPSLSTMSLRGEKGIFTLHVNSFSNKIEAGGYVTQLRKSGYKAFLVATKSEERGTIYRVRIGPFFSKNEAEKYRKKFEENEGVPTYVVKRVLEK